MKKSVMLMAGILAVALAGSAQAAGSTMFAVQDTNGTVDQMLVDQQGWIGINTTGVPKAPQAGLHIQGPTNQTTQTIMQFTGATSANGGGGYLGYHNNAGGGLPVAEDRLGYFLFGSFKADGVSPVNAAGIEARTDNAWSTTSSPSYFKFMTTPNGVLGNVNNRIERLRITSYGAIGIGNFSSTGALALNTNPMAYLDVNGGIRINSTAAVAAANPTMFDGTTGATCNATTRGSLWLSQGGAGIADALYMCVKNAADSYVANKIF